MRTSILSVIVVLLSWMACSSKDDMKPGTVADEPGASPSKLTRKAAAAEVPAIFAELRLRQEQYHVENGAYLSTGKEEADYHPARPAGKAGRQSLTPQPAAWDQLRVTPEETQVACAYVAIAGAGDDATNIGPIAKSFGMEEAPSSNWFYLVAECDSDGDPKKNAFFFTRSDSQDTQKRDPTR